MNTTPEEDLLFVKFLFCVLIGFFQFFCLMILLDCFEEKKAYNRYLRRFLILIGIIPDGCYGHYRNERPCDNCGFHASCFNETIREQQREIQRNAYLDAYVNAHTWNWTIPSGSDLHGGGSFHFEPNDDKDVLQNWKNEKAVKKKWR